MADNGSALSRFGSRSGVVLNHFRAPALASISGIAVLGLMSWSHLYSPQISGHVSQAMRKDRTLTASAFENFLQQLNPHRETAGREYSSLHAKLVLWFERRHCSNAPELASLTLETVADKMADKMLGDAPWQPDDLMAYCLGVAKNHLLHHNRELVLRQAPFDEVPLHFEARRARAAQRDVMEKQAQEKREKCLRRCWQRLSSDEQCLLEEYYHEDWGTQVRQRRQLAARLRLTEIALRSRAHRLRAALKDCMKRCQEKV